MTWAVFCFEVLLAELIVSLITGLHKKDLYSSALLVYQEMNVKIFHFSTS